MAYHGLFRFQRQHPWIRAISIGQSKHPYSVADRYVSIKLFVSDMFPKKWPEPTRYRPDPGALPLLLYTESTSSRRSSTVFHRFFLFLLGWVSRALFFWWIGTNYGGMFLLVEQLRCYVYVPKVYERTLPDPFFQKGVLVG